MNNNKIYKNKLFNYFDSNLLNQINLNEEYEIKK